MQAQLETKEQAWELIHQIEEQVRKVIIGQDDLVRRILLGLFGRIPYSFRRGEEEKSGAGHILLEGVPGLAKTLLVSAISNTIHAKFQRIQFTPDMLPADILGTRIYDSKLASSERKKVLFSPISSWRTKSTALPRKPRVRCWKPCKSGR